MSGNNGNGKRPVGRPVKWDTEKLAEDMLEYTRNNLVPCINAFCYDIGLNSIYLWELAKKSDKLTESIKLLIDKKIADTEKGMIIGKINPTVGIWILKQLGQTDRASISILDHTDKEPLIPEINNHIDSLIDAEFEVE